MKKINLISLLLVLFMPVIGFAQEQFNKVSKADQELQAKTSTIEIIEGKPKKKFVKLQPVWATASSIDGAIKKIKKQAAKQGADAIIDFQMVTDKNAAASGFEQFFIGTSYAQPIVQGWAVKWQ